MITFSEGGKGEPHSHPFRVINNTNNKGTEGYKTQDRVLL